MRACAAFALAWAACAGSAGQSGPSADLPEASFAPQATRSLRQLWCPTIPRPYLWRVEPRQAEAAPSFLFGTMHLGIDAATLPPGVFAAADAARVLVFEVDPDEPDGPPPPPGPPLPEQLGPELWARLRALGGEAFAQHSRDLDPGIAALLLGALYLDKSVTLDDAIAERAAARGQDRQGLETGAFQQALLARWLDLRALRATLLGTEDRRELLTEAREAVTEYCAGTDDDPGMKADERAELLAAGYTAEELARFEEELLGQRNRAWIAPLEAHLASGGAFVVVGADHLRGPGGVPRLLAERGWTVERVSPGAAGVVSDPPP